MEFSGPVSLHSGPFVSAFERTSVLPSFHNVCVCSRGVTLKKPSYRIRPDCRPDCDMFLQFFCRTLVLLHAHVFHLMIPGLLHEYIVVARWGIKRLMNFTWVHSEKGAKLRLKCGDSRLLLEASTPVQICGDGAGGLSRWEWGRALFYRFFLKSQIY